MRSNRSALIMLLLETHGLLATKSWSHANNVLLVILLSTQALLVINLPIIRVKIIMCVVERSHEK